MTTYELKQTVLSDINEMVWDNQSDKRPVRITTYWNSHGKLVPFKFDDLPQCTTIRNKSIKIWKSTRIVAYDDLAPTTFHDFVLYIDDKRINGTVNHMNTTDKCVYIKLVCGWG